MPLLLLAVRRLIANGLKDLEKSKEDVDLVLQISPANAEALHLRALIHRTMGNKVESIADASALFSLDTNTPDYTLVHTLEHFHEFSEAIKIYEQQIDKSEIAGP